MRTLLLLIVAACAAGTHVTQRAATGRIAPAERDAVVVRAMDVLQQRGWLLAVSDRAGGVLTTQPMATGFRPCGIVTCESRSALQVAVTESGSVSVNLHRELNVPPPGKGWFVPTLDRDVAPIEAEQREILNEIIGR